MKKAVYVKSSVALEQCPKPKLPEFAVIGRSNVGKSSLINMLTGQGALAKVSKTPGASLALLVSGSYPTCCTCGGQLNLVGLTINLFGQYQEDSA